MLIISQKRDDIWTFRCYGAGGEGSFDGWYENLPPKVQVEIDKTIELLTGTLDWLDPTYKDLRGSGEGLGRIAVPVPNAEGEADQYRILGFKGPGKREFTLLFGFKEENAADYGAAIRTALGRKSGVERDGRRAPICNFP